MAPCRSCGGEYKGFGDTCPACRGKKPSVSYQKCDGCGEFFAGFGSVCAECSDVPAGAARGHRGSIDSPDGLVVPPELLDAIATGNCVAFVGAGFTAAMGFPGWGSLLRAIIERGAAEGKVDESHKAQLEEMVQKGTGSAFECCAQTLEDVLGNKIIAEVCAKHLGLPQRETWPLAMRDRLRYMLGIPFHAILTTNFDLALGGVPAGHPDGRKAMRTILRSPPLSLAGQIGRNICANITDFLDKAAVESFMEYFNTAEFSDSEEDDEPPEVKEQKTGKLVGMCPVVQLHGSVAEQYQENPGLAFTRLGYRKLLHGDPTYQRFLSTVMATKTVLYLGFSFSDEYINELRSSIMNMLGADGEQPIAYAIAINMKPAEVEFYEKHEGMKILNYVPREGAGYEGLEKWLAAIHNQTNPLFRWGRIFKQKRILLASRGKLAKHIALSFKIQELHFGRKGDLVDAMDLPKCKGAGAEDAEAALEELLQDSMPLHIVAASYRSGAAELFLRVMNRRPDLRAPVVVLDTSHEGHEEHKSEAFQWGAAAYARTHEEWLTGTMHILSPIESR